MQVEIVLLLLLAGVFQTFVYFRQLKKINALFVALRTRGSVLVGRKKTVFRGGAVVILRLSGQYTVEEAYIIQGYTAFAQTKPFNEAVGKSVEELATMGRGILNAAFRDALSHYQQSQPACKANSY